MRVLFTILTGLLAFALQAQPSNCSDALFEGNKLYEKGAFKLTIDKLTPCYKNGFFSKKEEIAALRLISICHLMILNSAEADKYAALLLKANPEYLKYPLLDPAEFSLLLDRYEVRPRFELGVHFGLSQYGVNVIQAYGTANTSAEFNGLLGFGAGLVACYNLNEHLSLGLDPSFQSMRYRADLDNVGGSKKEYSEIISALDVPLKAFYRFNALNRLFFISGGVQNLYLMNAFANVESRSLEPNSRGVSQSSTENTPYRKRHIPGANIGVGAEFAFGKWIFSAALSGQKYFSNFVLPEKRYENSEFITRSGYIDSDWSLQSLGLILTCRLPLTYNVAQR
jgi:hypothetical protein